MSQLELFEKNQRSVLELFQTDLRYSLWFWTATVLSALNECALAAALLARHLLPGQWMLLGSVPAERRQAMLSPQNQYTYAPTGRFGPTKVARLRTSVGRDRT